MSTTNVLARLKKVITDVDALAAQVVSAVQPPPQNARKVPVIIARTAMFNLSEVNGFQLTPQELFFTNGAESLAIERLTAFSYFQFTDGTDGAGNLARVPLGMYSSSAGLVPATTDFVPPFGNGTNTFTYFDWTWNYRLASTGVNYASSANNVPVPLLLSRTSLDWNEMGRVLSFSRKRPQRVAAGDSLIVTVQPNSYGVRTLTTGASVRFCVAVTLVGYRGGVMAG